MADSSVEGSVLSSVDLQSDMLLSFQTLRIEQLIVTAIVGKEKLHGLSRMV